MVLDENTNSHQGNLFDETSKVIPDSSSSSSNVPGVEQTEDQSHLIVVVEKDDKINSNNNTPHNNNDIVETETTSDTSKVVVVPVVLPSETQDQKSSFNNHNHNNKDNNNNIDDIKPSQTLTDTPKEMTSRMEHTNKVLHLCKDKMTTSTQSKVIVDAIKEIYKTKILPIEQRYHLHSLCLPTSGPVQDAEFDARPMVLLLGQYSTGKTTFIRHLLGVDFPGMHIGPEPTSDKFMALIHGNDHKIIKGNTLTVMPDLPFYGLSKFGSRFLNHFNGSVANSPLLQFMNMIDTPGILSGEKQRLSRDYPFSKTAKWFADRSDLILLLFDAHKLDISDEFKDVVETIRPHNDDKIRCVLNKADSVEKNQLVRVYGSLLWSMGKLFSTPEVVRVYAGSFWDKPLLHRDFESMFYADEEWLLDELMRLPSVSAERKVNTIVKRIRLIKVHLCLLGYIRKITPNYWGYNSTRKHILNNISQIFATVQHQYNLSEGDMPDINDFTNRLTSTFDDFRSIPTLDLKDLKELDEILLVSLPNVMKEASKTQNNTKNDNDDDDTTSMTKSIRDVEKKKLSTMDHVEKMAKNQMEIFMLLIQIGANLIFFAFVAYAIKLYFEMK